MGLPALKLHPHLLELFLDHEWSVRYRCQPSRRRNGNGPCWLRILTLIVLGSDGTRTAVTYGAAKLDAQVNTRNSVHSWVTLTHPAWSTRCRSDGTTKNAVSAAVGSLPDFCWHRCRLNSHALHGRTHAVRPGSVAPHEIGNCMRYGSTCACTGRCRPICAAITSRTSISR